jgi:predicted phage terminase large subunit-like protein
MRYDRADADALYRESFGAFTLKALGVLYAGTTIDRNWHIEALCCALEDMHRGTKRPRLVVNLPPRTLKSTITSVLFVAWLLGRNPYLKIICASYSDELTRVFSRDTRMLMQSQFYRRLFPGTRLSRDKQSETEFRTTVGGFRLATSVGGTLTGRGGDVCIIDDPIKASDATSDIARNRVIEWFHGTAMSRLDQPAKGLVIIVMQRLHADDLSGHLIEQGWPSFVVPAIGVDDQRYKLGPGLFFTRKAGTLLQPKRDSMALFEQIKHERGSSVFWAQYQQNPTPAEGNLIRAEWLLRYNKVPDRSNLDRIVIGCDTASKTGARNDFTAIVVAGIERRNIYVLEIARGRWNMRETQSRIEVLGKDWGPDLVLVEDTGTGTALIQLMREEGLLEVRDWGPTQRDKTARLSAQLGRFECGRILLPRDAPWLAEFLQEILGFPNARHDDQVDGLMFVLEWLAQNEDPLAALSGITPFSIPRTHRWDRFGNY